MFSGASLVSLLPLIASLQAVQAQQYNKPTLIWSVYGGDVVKGLDPAFPPAVSYTKTKINFAPGMYLPEGDLHRAVNDPNSEWYCGTDMTSYNVTYSDCKDTYVLSHCSKGQQSVDTVFSQFGRIPKSLRGAITDMNYNLGEGSNRVHGHSMEVNGVVRPMELLQFGVKATLNDGSDFHNSAEWIAAINKDSCILDIESLGDMNKTPPDYRTSLHRIGLLAAYNKLTGSWPTPMTNASCLSNQLSTLRNKYPQFTNLNQCGAHTYPVPKKLYSVLINRIDDLSASADRLPPAPKASWTKWAPNMFPEFCHRIANEPRHNNDQRAKCELSRLEVFNVTYNDCPQYPWSVCRCTDAQIGVQEMVDSFGRIPPGIRSSVPHIIMIDGKLADGSDNFWGGNVGKRFLISGPLPPTAFTHEAMHSADNNFHGTQGFNDAVGRDWCVATGYAASHPAENVAELGVYLNWNGNGKPLQQYLKTVNPTCLDNQVASMTGQFGSAIALKTSKCYAREANDRVVTVSGTQRVASAPVAPLKFDHVHRYNAQGVITSYNEGENYVKLA